MRKLGVLLFHIVSPFDTTQSDASNTTVITFKILNSYVEYVEEITLAINHDLVHFLYLISSVSLCIKLTIVKTNCQVTQINILLWGHK